MSKTGLPGFVKYPDVERLGDDENYGLFTPGDELVIEEKIDGGNAQFRLHEGQILFGTRNHHFQVAAEGEQKQQFDENASWVVSMMGNTLGADSGRGLNPDYIYYGEWCRKHTINYDWATMPKFIGFDIRNTITGNFLPFAAMKEEFERLGLPVVPLITRIKAEDLDPTRLENFIGKSAFYEGLMEGIVIKNYFRRNVYGRQLFAKVVRQEFKEANMAAFGGGIKDVKDDTSLFIQTFYTEARIRKAVLRLVDEAALPMSRKLMEHLPKDVIQDILKEEAWTIVKEFETINFNMVRKMAPKFCLQVLDKMLTERAAEVSNAESGNG